MIMDGEWPVRTNNVHSALNTQQSQKQSAHTVTVSMDHKQSLHKILDNKEYTKKVGAIWFDQHLVEAMAGIV